MGFLLWCSGLRIQHCHCRSLDGSCGMGLISGPGTFTCVAKKKKKKKKEKLENQKYSLNHGLQNGCCVSSHENLDLIHCTSPSELLHDQVYCQ